MARDFNIDGEVLVLVKGGLHTQLFTSGNISTVQQLGLCADSVRVVPRWMHKDINTDDFGPEIPAELMTLLGDVTITLPLIHYDPLILDVCVAESIGGSVNGNFAGTLPPAGTMMGANLAPLSSGCHYISLSLLSPRLNFPWHFPTTIMTGPPIEFPLGVEATVAVATFRAVPYAPLFNIPSSIVGEAFSSGRVLWDRKPDTN